MPAALCERKSKNLLSQIWIKWLINLRRLTLPFFPAIFTHNVAGDRTDILHAHYTILTTCIVIVWFLKQLLGVYLCERDRLTAGQYWVISRLKMRNKNWQNTGFNKQFPNLVLCAKKTNQSKNEIQREEKRWKQLRLLRTNPTSGWSTLSVVLSFSIREAGGAIIAPPLAVVLGPS